MVKMFLQLLRTHSFSVNNNYVFLQRRGVINFVNVRLQ